MLLTILLAVLIAWLATLSYVLYRLSAPIPEPVHVPVATPIQIVAAPPVPAPVLVSFVPVRYVDAHGRTVGDESIDKRQRRAIRTYAGQRFEASHETGGVWIYRQVIH